MKKIVASNGETIIKTGGRSLDKVRGKMTAEARELVLKAVRSGAYPSAAATMAGIRPALLLQWIKRGREAKRGPYAQFVRDFDRAAGECEVMITSRFLKATEHDWKAAAELLKLRFPERWGSKKEVVVKGPGKDGAIRHAVAGLVVNVVPSRVVDADGRVIKEADDISGLFSENVVEDIIDAEISDDEADEEAEAPNDLQDDSGS